MTRYFYIVIVTIVLCLSIGGCTETNKDVQYNDSMKITHYTDLEDFKTNNISFTTIDDSFETIPYTKIDFNSISSENRGNFSIEYPVFSNIEHGDLLNKNIYNSIVLNVQGPIDTDESKKNIYTFNLVRIENILGLLYTSHATYGPRSSEEMRGYYFDLNTGSMLTLLDLIKTEKQNEFFDQIIQQVPIYKAQYQHQNEKNIEEIYNDVIFFISEEGLILTFEKTPDDFYSYFISWSDISTFLNEESRFYKIIKSTF